MKKELKSAIKDVVGFNARLLAVIKHLEQYSGGSPRIPDQYKYYYYWATRQLRMKDLPKTNDEIREYLRAQGINAWQPDCTLYADNYRDYTIELGEILGEIL